MAVSQPPHSTVFRKVFEIMIGGFISCEISQMYFTFLPLQHTEKLVPVEGNVLIFKPQMLLSNIVAISKYSYGTGRDTQGMFSLPIGKDLFTFGKSKMVQMIAYIYVHCAKQDGLKI